MAIEFARAEFVSRSNGKNACCKSAYNARARIADEKTNVIYTFERLGDNVHHEILLPKCVDEKFKNVSILANEVERSEKRQNSQLYKEYVLALPDNKELTLEDRIELARRFLASKKFTAQGLGVQLDIHAPHDGDKNWHAHILVTTRRFKESGESLGEKARDLNPEVRGGQKAFVVEGKDDISKLWRDIQNEYFIEKKISIRVDQISNNPGVHLGPVRMRAVMNEQTIQNAEKRQNAQDNIRTGDDLIAKVVQTKAVFHDEDIQRAAISIENENHRQRVIAEAKQSQEIVELFRANGSSANCWTTKIIRSMEQRIVRIADKIHSRTGINITPAISHHLESRKLEGYISEAQAEALEAILSNNRGITILQGRAGTGKSHVLGVLNELVKDNRSVIGLAPTHRAAMELKSRGYNNVDTVKGFLFKNINGKISVTSDSLIILDEAGMVGSETYLELLKVVRDNKASLILVGDDKQLASIEFGGMLSLFSERYGATYMNEIKRQVSDWGRSVSSSFAKGDIEEGINVLNEQKKVIIAKDRSTSCSHLLEHWSQNEQLLANKLIIAISNKNVDLLNLGAREILKERGYIQGQEFEVENQYTKAVFGVNDRIVIAESNKKIGVQNGEFGTIKSVSAENFRIKFDDGRELDIDPHQTQFKHGYAATVYKTQGASVKVLFILHTGFATMQNAYVAMSRFVEDMYLYCNLEDTKDAKELVKQMSEIDRNVSSLHYKTKEDFDIQNEANSIFGKVVEWVKEKAEKFGYNSEQISAYRPEKSLEVVINSDRSVDFNIQYPYFVESFRVRFDDGKEIYLDHLRVKYGYVSTTYKTLVASEKAVFTDSMGDSSNSQISPTSRSIFDKISGWMKGKVEKLGDTLHNNPNYYEFDKGQVINNRVEQVLANMSDSFENRQGQNSQFLFEDSAMVNIEPEELDKLNNFFDKTESLGILKERIPIVTEHLKLQIYSYLVPNFKMKFEGAKEVYLDKYKIHCKQYGYVSIAHKDQVIQDKNVLVSHAESANTQVIKLKNSNKGNMKIEHTNAVKNGKQNFANNTTGREKYNQWNDNVARIRHELKFKAEAIAKELLGEPNKHLSTLTRLRFGESGKMSVDIAGDRAGLWHDFSSGVGGDILGLIQRERNVDFKGAIKLAQEYASVVYVDIVQEKHLRVLNQVANDLSKEQKIINLRATTRSINALGIKYLRSRGISCELPDSIRMKDDMWHSEAKQKLPVLVSFAKNPKGEITAAQSIYLDKSSGAKAKVMPAKRTLGALKGSFVEIQKNI